MAGNKKPAPSKQATPPPVPALPRRLGTPKQRTQFSPRRRAIVLARQDLNIGLRKVSQPNAELHRISHSPVDTPEYLAKRAQLTQAERNVERLRIKLAEARAVPPTQTLHEVPKQATSSVALLERLRLGLVKL